MQGYSSANHQGSLEGYRIGDTGLPLDFRLRRSFMLGFIKSCGEFESQALVFHPDFPQIPAEKKTHSKN